MYGAVRKTCPPRISDNDAKEVQDGHNVENGDCMFIPVVPNYFRTLHQYNKTEIMLDNENQMHRDVTIYFFFMLFQNFFDTQRCFLRWIYLKNQNNNIIINNNNNKTRKFWKQKLRLTFSVRTSAGAYTQSWSFSCEFITKVEN